MSVPNRLTRRSFLASSAITGAAAAVPWVITRPVRGEKAASARVNVAFIGTGNQGMGLLKRFLKWDLGNVVAVCDVNRGSLGYKEAADFYGREPAQKLVAEHIAEQTKSGANGGCTAYQDFREVLDRKDVDAVFLVVPDHWHAPMTILAAAAGKQIYCEKPLSLTVTEGREMIAAAQRHNVMVQTGSHERSNPISKFVCEAVKRGAIGKVTKVVTTIGYNNKESPAPGWKAAAVPEGFEYNMWLGPAPVADFHPDRCLYRFRFIYDYSGGQITNFGAHCNDMAHWGLGEDRGGPTEIECLDAKFLPSGSLFNTATETVFRCKYASGVELVCESGKPSVQTRFEGTDGWMQTGYGGTTASRPELLKGLPVVDKKKDKDPHSLHLENFIESVKQKIAPAAPIEVGHASAVLCHIANVAIRRFPTHGRQLLQWDPVKERFTNNDEANAQLTRPRRSPWDRVRA